MSVGAAVARLFGREGFSVGLVGPGQQHEPATVAEQLWQCHVRRDQALVVLR